MDNTNVYVATYTNCNFYNTEGFTTPNCTNCSITSPNTGNPMFTNAPGGDFTIQLGSALIDKGMDGSTINAEANKDRSGNYRSSVSDIGAFEH